MNKNMIAITVVGIVIVVLMAGGILFFNQQNSSEKMMDKSSQSMQKDGQNEASSELGGDRYVTYSSTALEDSKDGRRLLYFYANWCPICRPVNEELTSNADKIPEGLTIIRVNYNDTDTDSEEKELAKKYNITYQHTFVLIDENGNEIKKWNGGGLDQILSNLN